MDERKEIGLLGWVFVLAVVYVIAPFIYIVDWVKGDRK